MHSCADANLANQLPAAQNPFTELGSHLVLIVSSSLVLPLVADVPAPLLDSVDCVLTLLVHAQAQDNKDNFYLQQAAVVILGDFNADPDRFASSWDKASAAALHAFDGTYALRLERLLPPGMSTMAAPGSTDQNDNFVLALPSLPRVRVWVRVQICARLHALPEPTDVGRLWHTAVWL